MLPIKIPSIVIPVSNMPIVSANLILLLDLTPLRPIAADTAKLSIPVDSAKSIIANNLSILLMLT